METQHLHDQIARATSRLAQLQARQLLMRHREEARAREDTRRRAAARRSELGRVVIAAGGDDLADGEVATAVINYLQGHESLDRRKEAKLRGDAHLAAVAAQGSSRLH